MKAKRRQFREELLPVTLRHAAQRVEGYRALWGDRVSTDGGLDSLSQLPLTSKAIFAADPDAFRDHILATAALQHTGGTTKQPLIMQRSSEELEYIRTFFTAVIDGFPAREAPLCISVFGNFHGDPTPMPYPGPTFRLDVNDGYWDLPALLTRPAEYIGRPIDDIILVGLESQLRMLTCRLIESDFDFATSAVRSLHSTGDLLTSRLRRFYEETWGCPITSRYSMSEVVGGAELCRHCDHYHCDTHIIPEAVNAMTGDVVSEGVGVLVLTSLFPFVQKQPMIRYRTGDLVRLGPRTCHVDEFAFHLCGREIHTVFDPNQLGEAVLIGAELYDIIDKTADVALSEFKEMFKSLGGLSSHFDLGHPKYRVSYSNEPERFCIRVGIELRYLWYLYPDRSSKVREQIREEILSAHPRLATEIKGGAMTLEIDFVLPGTLQQVQVDETE